MEGVLVQVPGKVMLAGEYAVLAGHRSLAVTMDTYVWVEALSTRTECFRIESDLWAEPFFWQKNQSFPQSIPPSYRVAVSALEKALQFVNLSGGNFTIRSDFAVENGMGSSSAVYLGMLLAIQALASDDPSPRNPGLATPCGLRAAQWAHELQRREQGYASGYDIITQMTGGAVLFTPPPMQQPLLCDGVQALPLEDSLSSWLHIYVGGKGAATKSVGGSTLAWLQEHQRQAGVNQLADELVTVLVSLLSEAKPSSQNMKQLFAQLKKHRELFIDSPHYPREIATALVSLAGIDQTWSFKTTGAGGEDALLVFGEKSQLQPADEVLQKRGWYPFTPSFTQQGAALFQARTSPCL